MTAEDIMARLAIVGFDRRMRVVDGAVLVDERRTETQRSIFEWFHPAGLLDENGVYVDGFVLYVRDANTWLKCGKHLRRLPGNPRAWDAVAKEWGCN